MRICIGKAQPQPQPPPTNVVQGLTAGDNDTHAAANLTVLQTALDAAEAAGGGTVIKPAGVHRFAGTARIGTRVVYAGQGWGSVHKLAAGASTAARPVSVLAAKNGSNYVGVENLYLDGNKAAQTDTTYQSHGIDYTRATTEGSGPPVYDGGLWCRNVMVYGCQGVGFNFYGPANTARAHGCSAYHNDDAGFYVKSDSELNGCVAGNNGGYGYRAYAATSVRWTSLKAFGNCQRYPGADYLVGYSESVALANCIAEDSGQAGFWFTSVRHLTVAGCHAYRCAGHLSDSYRSAFWIEDDGAGNLCSKVRIVGDVKADGGAAAFNYALTTRNLGVGCHIDLTSEGAAFGTHHNLSGVDQGLSDAVINID